MAPSEQGDGLARPSGTAAPEQDVENRENLIGVTIVDAAGNGACKLVPLDSEEGRRELAARARAGNKSGGKSSDSSSASSSNYEFPLTAAAKAAAKKNAKRRNSQTQGAQPKKTAQGDMEPSAVVYWGDAEVAQDEESMGVAFAVLSDPGATVNEREVAIRIFLLKVKTDLAITEFLEGMPRTAHAQGYGHVMNRLLKFITTTAPFKDDAAVVDLTMRMPTGESVKWLHSSDKRRKVGIFVPAFDSDCI